MNRREFFARTVGGAVAIVAAAVASNTCVVQRVLQSDVAVEPGRWKWRAIAVRVGPGYSGAPWAHVVPRSTFDRVTLECWKAKLRAENPRAPRCILENIT